MSETSWHPLRCLTRTDAEISTLFYGFFLVDYIDSKGDLHVSKTIPLYNRAELAGIQQGLLMHVLEALNNANSEYTDEDSKRTYHKNHVFGNPLLGNTSPPDIGKREKFGSFVTTTAKANRYHCFWRGNESMMLIGLSVFPFPTFARQVFECLGGEIKDNLVPTLVRLCECPILPACNIDYTIRFSTGEAVLSFSAHEQVNDVETLSVALRLLTPMMLIRAWEAVILERKLLVVSSRTAVLEPCCEFIRRLALPLNLVSSYMPLLWEQAITAIEAPFPYLYGANSNLLDKYKSLDLSDTIILDLDMGHVRHPTRISPVRRDDSTDLNSQKAPQSMVKRLRDTLNDILLTPISNFIRRPQHAMVESGQAVEKGDSACYAFNTNPLASRESQAAEIIRQGNAVIEIFIRENLTLLGAQRCPLRVFVREPKALREKELAIRERNGQGGAAMAALPPRISLRVPRAAETIENVGYERTRGGLVMGYMEYILTSGTIPVWVEATEKVFSVFAHADELPLFQISFMHVDNVAAAMTEPVGHVFELTLTNCVVHRFQVGGKAIDVRPKWIAVIDRYTTKSKNKSSHEDVSDKDSLLGSSDGREIVETGI